MHIRKLDKRVKRYRDELESRKKEQLKRVEEQQRQMIRRNLEYAVFYQYFSVVL